MEIEALAIIYALQKFRHYLLGRHFKKITDHSALKVLNSKATKNARVERWALILSEYDYEIIYQKEKLHEDVDCLSRAPVDKEDDKQEQNEIATIMFAVPIDSDDWMNEYNNEESQDFLHKAESNQQGFHLRDNR